MGLGALNSGFFYNKVAVFPPVPYLSPLYLLITVAAYESSCTGLCLNDYTFLICMYSLGKSPNAEWGFVGA
jgi:hypothetical protein